MAITEIRSITPILETKKVSKGINSDSHVSIKSTKFIKKISSIESDSPDKLDELDKHTCQKITV